MEITGYLNQRAVWQPQASPGRDEWGNIVTLPGRTISVRKTTKTKWRNSKSELALMSITEYLTNERITLGDLLDGMEIQTVEELIDFDGSYIGCKAIPNPNISLGQ